MAFLKNICLFGAAVLLANVAVATEGDAKIGKTKNYGMHGVSWTNG